MTRTGGSHDFVYVQSDIPEEMTIRAWRAQRAADSVATSEAMRTERRQRRRQQVRRWVEALHIWSPEPRLQRRAARR